jgi:DNA-3-methyladenine glycosylase II
MYQILAAEKFLSVHDSALAGTISKSSCFWPVKPTEDPIWGLLRMVMAQQIATSVACRLAERVKTAFPLITSGSSDAVPDSAALRPFGLPERRAQCCVTILQKSDEIRTKVHRGQSWEEALKGIKGIGPWTIAVFQIMVLRDPDVLPLGDVGLERAIANVYGPDQNVEALAEKWRPYRSVACWYLWRTLGNEQLG